MSVFRHAAKRAFISNSTPISAIPRSCTRLRLIPLFESSTKPLISFSLASPSTRRCYASENESHDSRAAETGEEVKDAASSLAQNLGDTAREAQDAAESGAEKVGDVARDLSDSARDVARDSAATKTAEEIRDTASNAAENLRETANEAQDAASTGTEKLSDAARDMGGAARDVAETARATPAESSSPDTRTPVNASLYVGNLFFEVKASDLRDLFSRYGEIEEAKIITDQRRLSKGFGYVTFTSKGDAENARAELNQTAFQGRTLVIGTALRSAKEAREMSAIHRPTSPPSRTLFVGNMSYEMTDKDLNSLFHDVKGVMEVRVAIDRRTGQPRGFAHVDFTDLDSAKEAVEYLYAKEFYGRRLKLDYSTSSRLRQPE